MTTNYVELYCVAVTVSVAVSRETPLPNYTMIFDRFKDLVWHCTAASTQNQCDSKTTKPTVACFLRPVPVSRFGVKKFTDSRLRALGSARGQVQQRVKTAADPNIILPDYSSHQKFSDLQQDTRPPPQHSGQSREGTLDSLMRAQSPTSTVTGNSVK